MLVFKLSISLLTYFILPLHCILEAIIVLFRFHIMVYKTKISSILPKPDIRAWQKLKGQFFNNNSILIKKKKKRDFSETDMWGESKEDMRQRWSCNQMEQCLKALGHGGIPKVPLHIIDCGGSCSLDTTLRTGV